MQFEERRVGDIVVFAPGGDLTTSEDCAAFEAKLRAVVGAGTHDLIIDCTAVNHIGSTALRALLAASRRLAISRGQVILCGMGEMLTRVFAISGFIRGFPVLGTADEAVQWTIERRNELIAAGPGEQPSRAPDEAAAAAPAHADASVEPGTSGQPAAPAPVASPPEGPSREIRDLADALERFLAGAAPARALHASCQSALPAEEIDSLAERLLAVVGAARSAAFTKRAWSRTPWLL